MKRKLNCILLIDDEEPTNWLNKRLIKKMDCTEKVIAMEGGEEALQFLTSKAEGGEYPKPDLIFLDINMPGMSGWDFLDEYNKLDIQQRGKIILVMLTTSLNIDDEEKSKSLPGINGFLNKPLTKEVLDQLLRKHFPTYI